MKQAISVGGASWVRGRDNAISEWYHHALGFRLVEDLPAHQKIVTGYSWVISTAEIARKCYYTGKSLSTRTRGIRLVEDL